MPTGEHRRHSFQLELLETRTLLAGDDAIVSSGSFLTNYDPLAIASKISIISTVGGQLTIDSALLSDQVTDLKISGFDTVIITGTDKFSSLDLSHIGVFSAVDIHIQSELEVRNVGTVKIESVAGVAWLYGTESRLEVADARSATIVSNLDRLTVSSQNDLVLLADADQEIRVEYDTTRPTLVLPANNVTFVDTTPSPGNPTDNPSQPGEGGNPPPTVIVISLSSPLVAELFRDALKKGDTDALREAFAAYMEAVNVNESAAATTFLAGTPAEIKVAQADLITPGDTPDDRDDTEHVDRPLLHLPRESTFAPDLRLSDADEVKVLPRFLGDAFDTVPAPDTSLNALDSAASNGDAVDQRGRSVESSQSGNGSSLLNDVRLTLSSLAFGIDTQFHSVSSYIINDVGTKLEPGVLPGLLVDAKLSRVRREIDWIEI